MINQKSLQHIALPQDFPSNTATFYSGIIAAINANLGHWRKKVTRSPNTVMTSNLD
jgi:hypothetical protein